MTVLVTGSAGYIGSHMVHALVDAGERVVVLDNLTTGFDWAVAKGARLVVGETGDQPRVAALIAEHRIDAVIHWAPRKIAPPRQTPQNCPRMIPLRSSSDSFTFTPGLSAIASESSF